MRPFWSRIGGGLRVPSPRLLGGALVAILCMAAAPSPASAQFGLFGQSGASPQDVYDTVASHGFRMAGPLYRNGNVYVADVFDRRRRRERLIISADSGEIMQRFFVDVAAAPRAVAPPGNEDFFSRLVRGWGDDAPPRPPAGLDTDNEAVMPLAPVPLPRREPRPRPIEPRIVTRTEEAPITSSPLPAPARAPTPPASASLPPKPAPGAPDQTPGPTPPTSTRATTVVNDPLRIPGERDATAPKAAAVAVTKPTPPPVKLPTAKPADVPVAPLD